MQRVREKDSVCGVSVENMSESGSFDPPPPDQSVTSLLLLRANKAGPYYLLLLNGGVSTAPLPSQGFTPSP